MITCLSGPMYCKESYLHIGLFRIHLQNIHLFILYQREAVLPVDIKHNLEDEYMCDGITSIGHFDEKQFEETLKCMISMRGKNQTFKLFLIIINNDVIIKFNNKIHIVSLYVYNFKTNV